MAAVNVTAHATVPEAWQHRGLEGDEGLGRKPPSPCDSPAAAITIIDPRVDGD